MAFSLRVRQPFRISRELLVKREKRWRRVPLLAGNAPGLSGDLPCRGAWRLLGGHARPARETPPLFYANPEA